MYFRCVLGRSGGFSTSLCGEYVDSISKTRVEQNVDGSQHNELHVRQKVARTILHRSIRKVLRRDSRRAKHTSDKSSSFTEPTANLKNRDSQKENPMPPTPHVLHFQASPPIYVPLNIQSFLQQFPSSVEHELRKTNLANNAFSWNVNDTKVSPLGADPAKLMKNELGTILLIDYPSIMKRWFYASIHVVMLRKHPAESFVCRFTYLCLEILRSYAIQLHMRRVYIVMGSLEGVFNEGPWATQNRPKHTCNVSDLSSKESAENFSKGTNLWNDRGKIHDIYQECYHLVEKIAFVFGFHTIGVKEMKDCRNRKDVLYSAMQCAVQNMKVHVVLASFSQRVMAWLTSYSNEDYPSLNVSVVLYDPIHRSLFRTSDLEEGFNIPSNRLKDYLLLERCPFIGKNRALDFLETNVQVDASVVGEEVIEAFKIPMILPYVSTWMLHKWHKRADLSCTFNRSVFDVIYDAAVVTEGKLHLSSYSFQTFFKAARSAVHF